MYGLHMLHINTSPLHGLAELSTAQAIVKNPRYNMNIQFRLRLLLCFFKIVFDIFSINSKWGIGAPMCKISNGFFLPPDNSLIK